MKDDGHAVVGHQLVRVVADDGLDGGSDVVVPRRRWSAVVDQVGVEGFDDLLLITFSVIAPTHQRRF
jgi:hypothetical protein